MAGGWQGKMKRLDKHEMRPRATRKMPAVSGSRPTMQEKTVAMSPIMPVTMPVGVARGWSTVRAKRPTRTTATKIAQVSIGNKE